MPTIGAPPSGGSRWLWILPLGVLPFLHGGGGGERPAEIVPPVTTPVTPTTPTTELPPTSTVPEPGTLGLLGAGLAMVGVAARRRRAR